LNARSKSVVVFRGRIVEPVHSRAAAKVILITGNAGRDALETAAAGFSPGRHAIPVRADHAVSAGLRLCRLLLLLARLCGFALILGHGNAMIGGVGHAAAIDVAIGRRAFTQIIHPIRMGIAADAFGFEAIDGDRL
jgi:hypothetical protein